MSKKGGKKSVQQIVKLLTVKEADVIGSYSDPKQKYPADIDIDDKVINWDPKDILKYFQEFFIKAQNDPDITITDFKAGHWKADVPLRWDFDDIQRGYKTIEKNKITFLDALHQKSTIKIDLIVDIDDVFTDINATYFFTYKDGSSTVPETKQDPKEALLKQFRELLKDNKVFKALKRLYSLSKLEDDKESQDWLLQYFNSSIGKMWQTIAMLENVSLLLKHQYKDISKIDSNLELIKNRLPSEYKKLIDDVLKDKSRIDNVIDILKCDLNRNLVSEISKK